MVVPAVLGDGVISGVSGVGVGEPTGGDVVTTTSSSGVSGVGVGVVPGVGVIVGVGVVGVGVVGVGVTGFVTTGVGVVVTVGVGRKGVGVIGTGVSSFGLITRKEQVLVHDLPKPTSSSVTVTVLPPAPSVLNVIVDVLCPLMILPAEADQTYFGLTPGVPPFHCAA